MSDVLNGHPVLHEEGSKKGHKDNVVVAKTLEINVYVPSEDPGVAEKMCSFNCHILRCLIY